LQDALREVGLADDTNIVIAADHGFSTISKESTTSPAAKAAYPDDPVVEYQKVDRPGISTQPAFRARRSD
jgi:arylsulfatase A-like enzyme